MIIFHFHRFFFYNAIKIIKFKIIGYVSFFYFFENTLYFVSFISLRMGEIFFKKKKIHSFMYMEISDICMYFFVIIPLTIWHINRISLWRSRTLFCCCCRNVWRSPQSLTCAFCLSTMTTRALMWNALRCFFCHTYLRQTISSLSGRKSHKKCCCYYKIMK